MGEDGEAMNLVLQVGESKTWEKCPVCGGLGCEVITGPQYAYRIFHCTEKECASNGGNDTAGLTVDQLVGVRAKSPYDCYWSRRALAAEERVESLEATLEDERMHEV